MIGLGRFGVFWRPAWIDTGLYRRVSDFLTAAARHHVTVGDSADRAGAPAAEWLWAGVFRELRATVSAAEAEAEAVSVIPSIHLPRSRSEQL